MRKQKLLRLTVVLAFGLCGLPLLGEQGTEKNPEETQTKVGVVKKVDLTARNIVVMVAQEMTFTVNADTKIRQGQNAKGLADIQTGAKVKVEYTRAGNQRIATTIAILGGIDKPETSPAKVPGGDTQVSVQVGGQQRTRLFHVPPASKPTPGAWITIPLPQMPPTLANRMGNAAPPRMTIFFPRNYDLRRKHPLLILLSGGDGGTGVNPGIARTISEERDFVCADMPLFKATDPKGAGGMIMRDPDAKYMWPFFRTMLAKLDELVPNLDRAHQVLGGCSNGAHATQGLIDQSDGEIARRFSAFIFVEGGGRLEHYELLKGKPFLMVSSNSKSRPRAQQICDAAKDAGAKVTLVFEDIGQHGFPPAAYPAVRTWLRGPAMQ